MESKAGILLCTDDLDILQAAYRYFQSTGLALHTAEKTGPCLLAAIRALRPAVVLTELVMPGFDAISVLEALRQEVGPKPLILVLTRFYNAVLEAHLAALGALYCFTRPYDVQHMLARLHYLATLEPRQEAGTLTRQPAAQRDQRRVQHLLETLRLQPSRRGTIYLGELVLDMPLTQQGLPPSLTKELYPKVGRRHGASAAQVERAVRTAIEAAWKADKAPFVALCGPNAAHARPSNGVLIAAIRRALADW